MAAGGGLFCLVRRPRSYQKRPVLADMADCEVIERYRLSRARIEWLVEELKDELERNSTRSCPLSPETQVNIIVVVVVDVVLSLWLNDRQPVTVFKSLNDRKSDIFLKFKETKEPIQFKLSDVD